MAEAATAFLQRLERLQDPATREVLLQGLLDAGWDMGCWLRPRPGELFDGAPDDVRVVLDATASTAFGGASPSGDPHPDGLAQAPIDGDDACWVLITQQCDLLRDFRDEPFAEVARATWKPGSPMNHWRSSSRFAPLAPETENGGQWIVDLRDRALIAKDLLAGHAARQALPVNALPYFCRDRFRRRLGDRYARAAVPDAYAPVVAWLAGISKKGHNNEMVREWVLRPPDGDAPAELHAIGRTQAELDAVDFDGDRWATDLSDDMPADVAALIAADIHWSAADAFPVATWDGAWRLDSLEHLSWREPDRYPLPPDR